METRFMDEAVRLSREYMELGEGGPFGCVIVKNGEIIGKGWNKVLKTNDPTAHAEICAIREACAYLNNRWLEGCELYTSCEPCPMCLGAIYWSRLDRVYYANTRSDAAVIGFDDAFIYDELILDKGQRKVEMIPMNKTAAMHIFMLWQQKEGKIAY